MFITAIEITDYKRVRKVAITPDADRHVILIGGKNGQGKSSTLDALTAAFGGAKQLATDPVRHGADEAAIFVELDGGKLTIDRTIGPDGKTKLEVRDAEGAVRSPQAVLDKLVGARFLDPLAFLALPAKEQRVQLMKLIKDADRIDTLNEKRGRAFDRRTELGRDLAKAEGELARLPEVVLGTPIEVAKLTERVRELGEEQRLGEALGAAVRAAEDKRIEAIKDQKRAVAELERIEAEIRKLADMLIAAKEEASSAQIRSVVSHEALDHADTAMKAAGEKWQRSTEERAKLDGEIAIANDHNRAVYAAEAQATRREETAVAVAKHKAEVTEVTGVIAKIDERKAEILAAAQLPVDGLSLGDDGILFGGVPFAQASDSERLRVALALAIAASPNLHDVWIHDGALLDDESLELVAKHAAAAGKRVWIERVGTKDAGAIVIQDGAVKS